MIIQTQKDLEKLCADLGNCPFITIDTEFLREKTYYPKLCLVQVSSPDGRAAAIDPLEGDLDLAPLFDLLFNEKILKVIHSGRQDLEIFYNLTGKVVRPFFDTQIAAMVCGYGDSVGYESLVRDITGEKLDKSVQFTDWSRRPLSKRQIDYALGDVIHLVKIYERLSDDLEKQGRTSWVYQEEEILAAPSSYENIPTETWRRIRVKSPTPKMLAILRELAAWRETQAQTKDIPRAWVMRDETLADMAAQMPADAAQLARIRNMSTDMANGHIGRTLLELIEKVKNSDKSTWPPVVKRKPLPPHAAATVDVLKLLLKVQCAHAGVAPKLVAGPDDLEALALSDNPDIAAMKGWRYELFGKDALALKKGGLALGLKGAKVTKYKVSPTLESYE
jgi:ribonuclease D